MTREIPLKEISQRGGHGLQKIVLDFVFRQLIDYKKSYPSTGNFMTSSLASRLCIASFFFVVQSQLNASIPLFQSYLASYHNTESPPFLLRNHSQEKIPLFTEMTILHLDVPPLGQIETLADRVLYADADVIHLTHISTHTANILYQFLQETYNHFICIPNKEQGMLIASKYPLSQVEISSFQETSTSRKNCLEFSIESANPCKATVCSNDAPMIIDLIDKKESSTIPLVIIDMPGTLTVVAQEFSPCRQKHQPKLLAAETFQIIPIKDKGKSNSGEKGGYKGEIDVGYSWGGKDGGHWEGSARFEAHDHHGNYVEAEVRQNEKGEGSANARAGHEEK